MASFKTDNPMDDLSIPIVQTSPDIIDGPQWESFPHISETMFDENYDPYTFLGKLFQAIAYGKNPFPEYTILGQAFGGDFDGALDRVVDLLDKASGNKLAYQRAIEERNYQNEYNSPAAEVARMLAAGLNPYNRSGSSGSAQSAAAEVPSGHGTGMFTDLASALFNGIQGMINNLHETPEELMSLAVSREELKSMKLDNLEKADNLGLSSALRKKELRKMDSDWEVQQEERERNVERYEEEKRSWFRAEETFSRQMRAMDFAAREAEDKHQTYLHDVTNWTIDSLLKWAQWRAYNDSHDEAVYKKEVLRGAEYAQLVAETNRIIALTEVARTQNLYLPEQYRDIHISAEDKHQISLLETKLMNGQITAQQYDNNLRKYGINASDPLSLRFDAAQGRLGTKNGVIPSLNMSKFTGSDYNPRMDAFNIYKFLEKQAKRK